MQILPLIQQNDREGQDLSWIHVWELSVDDNCNFAVDRSIRCISFKYYIRIESKIQLK